MLTILPENNKDMTDRVLSEFGTLSSPAVLTAREGEEIIGYAALDITEGRLRLLTLSLDHEVNFAHLDVMDRFLLDGLLKSAASYALNREILYLECENNLLFPFLRGYGFKEINNKISGYLSLLIHSC